MGVLLLLVRVTFSASTHTHTHTRLHHVLRFSMIWEEMDLYIFKHS